jgi:hypothetical protein
MPLLHWLVRERSWVRTHGSVSRRAVDYVGSPFPQEQWDLSNLSTPRESLPRTGTARRKRMPGVHGLAWEAYVSCWSGFSLQGVHRFESPRLSDMSNHLFVAVFS